MLIFGGVGRLYGAFIGVPLYMIAQDRFAQIDPAYWYFWIGLLLVHRRAVRARRRARLRAVGAALLRRRRRR